MPITSDHSKPVSSYWPAGADGIIFSREKLEIYRDQNKYVETNITRWLREFSRIKVS